MKKITLSILCMLFTVITVNSQITLVKDIVTTNGDSFPFGYLNGGNFTVFLAQGTNTTGIWASDGTEAGTINIGENITDIFSLFEENAILGGNLYFVVDNGTTGAELYKTDGTLSGTSIVKDINPDFGSTPSNLVVLNNQLFFTADDGQNGNQLYKSDGTEAGTSLVTAKVSFPSNITVFNNELYFEATDANFNSQLWKSDGTDAGTIILKQINGADASSPSNFTLFNNELFFTAFQTATGSELWKTDGTEVGTILVKDIFVGAQGNQFQSLIVNGNSFYFLANDGINGSELWQTNGTEASTTLVKNFSGDANSSNYADALALNASTTLFIVQTANEGREIWKTNGTEASTTLLKDIFPGTEWGMFDFNNFSSKSLVINNTAYFKANNGINGLELWKTDGTTSGTVMIKDINPNNNVDNGNGIVGGIYEVNNTIIFEAFNTDFNRELWKTDGTEAGTTIIKDSNPGVGWGASLDNNIVINNKLIYNGSNGNDGFELWSTDGTEAGTNQLKNIENAPQGSNPKQLTAALGKLFFEADSLSFTNSKLFVSDGSLSGTKRVVENNKSVIQPNALVEFNDKLFYYSYTFSEDLGLFFTNAEGTLNTFVKKINLNPGDNAGVTSMYHAKGLNKLFFAASDGVNGRELWVSDGTTANTQLVKDINTGADGSLPVDFFEFNNEVYFMTIQSQGIFNQTKKRTLWKTNGTEAGTLLLKEFSLRNFDTAPYFTIFDNKLYFTAYEMSTGGNFIWTTDGTVANTKMQAGIGDFNKNLVVIGNNLFFSGQPANEAKKLYKFDGTEVTLFKDFNAGNFGGYAPNENFVDLVNGDYYFKVNKNNETSLWKTDGTEAGTVIIKDNFGFINEIVKAGNNIYFSADDTINGTELWISDGTEAGTEMVQDLFLGINSFGTLNSSNPSNLTLVGDDLFFSANSQNFNTELFKVENAVLNINDEVASSLEVSFNLYPNPASNKISVESNQTIQTLALFNILGKKIREINVANKSSLDISTLSPGLYIIKAKISNKIISKKLIIK